jgi:hypothetical protein
MAELVVWIWKILLIVGVEWVKVEELSYRLHCPITTQRFDVQVWGDPALIGAATLMGLAVEDEATGERLLHVSQERVVST